MALRTSQRDQADAALALAVGIDQPLNRRVFEGGHDFSREALRIGGGAQIRENRARIPETIAIGTRAILPGTAPEDRREDDDCARLGQRRTHRGCPRKVVAPVAAPEPAQFQVGGRKVVKPGLGACDLNRRKIDLNRVERAGRRRRPKMIVLAPHALAPRETIGAKEDPRDRFEVERRLRRDRARRC